MVREIEIERATRLHEHVFARVSVERNLQGSVGPCGVDMVPHGLEETAGDIYFL